MIVNSLKNWHILFICYCTNTFAAPVNINTADASTIADSLAGIGVKKAQAIVDYRVKNGYFKTIEELTQVSGIGVKTIEKNKDDILLSDPIAVTPEKQPDIPEPVTKTVENPPVSSTKQFNISDYTITIQKHQ
jgi:competence protein ComEA